MSNTSAYSWIAVTPDEQVIYNDIFHNNEYNISTGELSHRCVVDVGANIGVFSFFSIASGAKVVYAFEPNASTFSKLVNNIRRAQTDTIIPLNVAVSDVSGGLVSITDFNESGHNSIYEKTGNQVLTISLKDFLANLQEQNIFLKVDCEGAEYDIFKDLSVEDVKNVSTLVIEIHADLHPTIKGFDFLYNKLKALGFKQQKVNKVYWWEYTEHGVVPKHELPLTIERWEKI